jgi:Flp pilus assembly pilin Flp
MRTAFGRNDEAGQGLAEYALILAFVALICITALGVLGQAIANSPGFSLI